MAAMCMLAFILLIAQELVIETDPSKEPVAKRNGLHDGVLASELGVVVSSVGLMGAVMSVLLKRQIKLSENTEPLLRRITFSFLSSFFIVTGLLRLIDGIHSATPVPKPVLDSLFWFQGTNYIAASTAAGTVILGFTQGGSRRVVAGLLVFAYLASFAASIHFDIKIFKHVIRQSATNSKVQLINVYTLGFGLMISTLSALVMLFDLLTSSSLKASDSKELFSDTFSEQDDEGSSEQPLKDALIGDYSTSEGRTVRPEV